MVGPQVFGHDPRMPAGPNAMPTDVQQLAIEPALATPLSKRLNATVSALRFRYAIHQRLYIIPQVHDPSPMRLDAVASAAFMYLAVQV